MNKSSPCHENLNDETWCCSCVRTVKVMSGAPEAIYGMTSVVRGDTFQVKAMVKHQYIHFNEICVHTGIECCPSRALFYKHEKEIKQFSYKHCFALILKVLPSKHKVPLKVGFVNEDKALIFNWPYMPYLLNFWCRADCQICVLYIHVIFVLLFCNKTHTHHYNVDLII